MNNYELKFILEQLYLYKDKLPFEADCPHYPRHTKTIETVSDLFLYIIISSRGWYTYYCCANVPEWLINTAQRNFSRSFICGTAN